MDRRAVVEILKRCKPLTPAHYLVFSEMNGTPLLVDHGYPKLRPRVETKRGFKTVKWVKSIELVEKEHDHEKKKIV